MGTLIISAILALSALVIAYVLNILAGMPEPNQTALDMIGTYLPYISDGIKFVNAFTHAEQVIPMAALCVGIHDVWVTYRLAMWVATKIPLLGVSDSEG